MATCECCIGGQTFTVSSWSITVGPVVAESDNIPCDPVEFECELTWASEAWWLSHELPAWIEGDRFKLACDIENMHQEFEEHLAAVAKKHRMKTVPD